MELLNFDLNLVYVPQNINELLEEVSRTRGRCQRLFILDDYCKKLEDEVKKIAAFKRELPLCMILLNDAIEKLKEALMHCSKCQGRRPQTKKLMALIGNSEDEEVEEEGEEGRVGRVNLNDSSDKREWLSSVPLWGSSMTDDQEKQGSVSEINLRREEDDHSAFENPIQLSNNINRDVAFKEQSCSNRVEVVVEQSEEVALVLGVSGTTPASKVGRVKYQYTPEQLQNTYKKPRRSWSPELHRCFLEALDLLGGWQAATPKKIRELMQVEGLTTDEVKSHLQKYRLHIRNSCVAQANERWLAREGYEDHSNLSISRSDSSQGPLPANGSEAGQEDDRSHGNNWRGAFFMAGEVDVQS